MTAADVALREVEVEGRIKRKLLALKTLTQQRAGTRVYIADGRVEHPVKDALAGAGTTAALFAVARIVHEGYGLAPVLRVELYDASCADGAHGQRVQPRFTHGDRGGEERVDARPIARFGHQS